MMVQPNSGGKILTWTECGNILGQSLKSSALTGGFAVLNAGIGMVQTKAIALILGRAGVGLFGICGLINDLTRSVAGMRVKTATAWDRYAVPRCDYGGMKLQKWCCSGNLLT